MTKNKSKSFWSFIWYQRNFYMIDVSMVCLFCLGLGAVVGLLNPLGSQILIVLGWTALILRVHAIYQNWKRKRKGTA